jgi:hypothetical protein
MPPLPGLVGASGSCGGPLDRAPPIILKSEPRNNALAPSAPRPRWALVERSHVHAEEHFVVVIDGILFQVGVGCDGNAWITNDDLVLDPEPEDEERAIRAALLFRDGQPPLVPSRFSCGCGGTSHGPTGGGAA